MSSLIASRLIDGTIEKIVFLSDCYSLE